MCVCIYVQYIMHTHNIIYHCLETPMLCFFFYQAELLKLILGVRALLHQGISQTFSDAYFPVQKLRRDKNPT